MKIRLKVFIKVNAFILFFIKVNLLLRFVGFTENTLRWKCKTLFRTTG